MKLYLHIENGEEKKTTKLTVPKSWYSKTVQSVLELYCESYNKKNVDSPLDQLSVHLGTSDGGDIYSDSVISEVLCDHGDFFVRNGSYMRKRTNTTIDTSEESKLLRCKNYGCGKSFSELENTDNCCRHHTGPPIFHDTIKFWSCCKDTKAYDWEEFQRITGCASSAHSIVDPKVALGSIRGDSTEDKQAQPQPVLKSISEYNKANPDAVTAAQSAVKTITSVERKSSRNEEKGTAKCKNKGCSLEFDFRENSPTSCRFHSGQAVFHDAIKYWSCCPEKKCYDFEAFLLVPGCVVGMHDDGVIELPPDHGQIKA